MSKGAPGFMTYREAAIMLTMLPDYEAGRVIKATAAYFLRGEVAELPGVCAQVFETMRGGVDRGLESWRASVEGGRRGGRRRWNREEMQDDERDDTELFPL